MTDNRTDHQGTSYETTATPTLSQEEILAQAESLVAEADFIAAGYDYQKAISMLESFEYYSQVPALSAKVDEYKTLDKIVSVNIKDNKEKI